MSGVRKGWSDTGEEDRQESQIETCEGEVSGCRYWNIGGAGVAFSNDLGVNEDS